jgi:hypothetical protein
MGAGISAVRQHAARKACPTRSRCSALPLSVALLSRPPFCFLACSAAVIGAFKDDVGVEGMHLGDSEASPGRQMLLYASIGVSLSNTAGTHLGPRLPHTRWQGIQGGSSLSGSNTRSGFICGSLGGCRCVRVAGRGMGVHPVVDGFDRHVRWLHIVRHGGTAEHGRVLEHAIQQNWQRRGGDQSYPGTPPCVALDGSWLSTRPLAGGGLALASLPSVASLPVGTLAVSAAVLHRICRMHRLKTCSPAASRRRQVAANSVTNVADNFCSTQYKIALAALTASQPRSLFVDVRRVWMSVSSTRDRTCIQTRPATIFIKWWLACGAIRVLDVSVIQHARPRLLSHCTSDQTMT